MLEEGVEGPSNGKACEFEKEEASVVKKTVGLGGWIWLVLTNGIEVKYQRNVLRIIETPIGYS
ncbi:hypothetical protein AMTR_s00036p00091830 [Amborella trichopoda]|uniref:Uncharacterized protein n=1 Tax=Amborella trichopoda TaxID=13333 RepID=U5D1N5_AMBTC|nr:hypothetical protein AMTR_s00036p00091830 [Amborella trichopoda]